MTRPPYAPGQRVALRNTKITHGTVAAWPDVVQGMSPENDTPVVRDGETSVRMIPNSQLSPAVGPAVDHPTTTSLPADIDPELWFTSAQCGGDRDYLFDSHWHTHPGRIAAYCPHDQEHPDYRISLVDLPADLPPATRYFVVGFLAGNLPDHPDVEWDSPQMERWRATAHKFAATGTWDPDLV